MIRFVLDTSALIPSISKKSRFRPIYDAILDGKVKLVISNDIVSEYFEKLEEKSNFMVAEHVVDSLISSRHVEFQSIHFFWQLIENDPDDNKFVDCYIAAGADYLVSNDRHFRVLKPDDFPSVQVISVEEFLKIVEAL